MNWMRCDGLTKDQPAEITMFQISEVQEAPAFNGRRSFLTLRAREHSHRVEMQVVYIKRVIIRFLFFVVICRVCFGIAHAPAANPRQHVASSPG